MEKIELLFVKVLLKGYQAMIIKNKLKKRYHSFSLSFFAQPGGKRGDASVRSWGTVPQLGDGASWTVQGGDRYEVGSLYIKGSQKLIHKASAAGC